jgi:serine/threonine-protein kinase
MESLDDIPEVGDTVDRRYRTTRVLGQGAEGAVFEAVHVFTGARVALKVTAPLGGPKVAERQKARMFHEAKVLGHLRHPGIVQVLDAGETGGLPYLVMELLEGRTLEGLVAARERLTTKDAVAVALQVCDALHAAHGAGVVHRDIKPSNVLVVRSEGGDRVKLVDFGTSKSGLTFGAKITTDGGLVGTPAYMAPEQLLGEADVDHRADLYALGAMLYEMLSGTVPYEGTFARILQAVCNDSPPPSVRVAVPHVEPAVARVIMRAMAKDRSQRYASAAQLAEELRLAMPSAAGALQLLDPPRTEAPRRRFARAPYITPVRLAGPRGPLDGRSEDVSEGGMLFVAKEPLARGELVHVRFALPIEGRVASAQARVQWVRDAGGGATCAIGLEFVQIAPEVRSSIARFVLLMTGAPSPAVEAPPVEAPAPVVSRADAKTTLPSVPRALALHR